MRLLITVSVIVFSLLCNVIIATRSYDYCYADSKYSYAGFATMTPYKAVRPKSMSFGDIIPKGCTPEHVWHLIRHGSREQPQKHDRKKMISYLPRLQSNIESAYRIKKGKLCEKDVSNIGTYKLPRRLKRVLSQEGKDEIRGIAARFRDTFPDLLKNHSSGVKPGKKMKLACSNDYRNLVSAKVYVEERFGSLSRYVQKPSRFYDGLQFYERCGYYYYKVYNIRKELKPVYKFMKSDHMKKLIRQISDRLGFPVRVKDVRTMYNTCRYFKAWYPMYLSAWCGAFTPDQLKVLEYWEDLRTYSEHGYGNEINYKSACDLGKDLLKQFRDRVENVERNNNSVIYFANAETLMSFIAYLGLFKDAAPLTEDTIPKSRLWRTSKFATYGSNLGFFLSSCRKDKWWVTAVLNERPLLLPGCKSALGCSWRTFLKHFEYLEDCDLKEICGGMSAGYPKTKQRHAKYKLDDLM